MNPVLWSGELPFLGLVSFPSYFSLLTVGFALAIVLAWRDAPRVEINPDKIIDLSLYIIIFSIIGSRLLHVLADGHLVEYINICVSPESVPVPQEVLAGGAVPDHCTTDAQCGEFFLCNIVAGHCHPPRDCLLALKIWRGGLTYYGGFISAILITLLFTRKNKLDLWKVGDLYGHGTALGLFWGRMGCYLNGCCFGKVTHGGLGMVFPRGGAVWRSQVQAGLLLEGASLPLPVHPTQLYSALMNLGVFAVTYFWIRPRKRFDGQVFWSFVLLKAVTRYLVEFFRDDDRGVYLGLISTSQIISLGFFALGLIMWRRLSRRAELGKAEPASN